MRRRALLASIAPAVGTAGCLSALSDENEDAVRVRGIEISHQSDDPETYHLLVRADDELAAWSSIDVEPRTIRTVCDDWAANATTIELLVRRDDRSDWNEYEPRGDDSCLGILYTDSRGIGFYEGMCDDRCSSEDATDSASDQNTSNSSVQHG